MTDHHGEVVAPQRVGIKSWWTAFMTGALVGGGLAAAVGFITVMSNG